jgi:hypothetical protein
MIAEPIVENEYANGAVSMTGETEVRRQHPCILNREFLRCAEPRLSQTIYT